MSTRMPMYRCYSPAPFQTQHTSARRKNGLALEYVSIYTVCLYTDIYTHAYACVYIRFYTRVYTHAFAYTYTHVPIRAGRWHRRFGPDPSHGCNCHGPAHMAKHMSHHPRTKHFSLKQTSGSGAPATSVRSQSGLHTVVLALSSV